MSGAYDRQGNYHNDPAWQQQEPPDWDGYTDELDDETTPDDCMTEDYYRGVDEIHGMHPQPDDHDRRFSEVYDGRTDIGDELLPPY